MTRGEASFEIGEESIQAAAGDIVVGPRDVPHRFKAGPEGATVLMLVTPAGLEGLVMEQSIPATRRELPRAEDLTPPNLERMAEIAVSYGCELLV